MYPLWDKQWLICSTLWDIHMPKVCVNSKLRRKCFFGECSCLGDWSPSIFYLYFFKWWIFLADFVRQSFSSFINLQLSRNEHPFYEGKVKCMKRTTLFCRERKNYTLEHLPPDDMSSLSPKQQAQHKNKQTAVNGFAHIHHEPLPNPFHCEKTVVIFINVHQTRMKNKTHQIKVCPA